MMDKAGRIVIPKRVREEMNLQAGDEFDLEVNGGGVRLIPKPARARMVNRGGIWVRTTGRPTTLDVVAEINRDREERVQQLIAHSNTPAENQP